MRMVTVDKGCTGTHIAYMGFERRMDCGRVMSTWRTAWEKTGDLLDDW